MNFLPTGYEAPRSNSSYTKFEEGETKIRILTLPILGWEDWDNKKPVRFRYNNKPITSLVPDKPFRHFWAFVVWNYKSSKIEILMLTQSSIRSKLESLSKDADWGAPFNYDIKIIKSGQGKETSYDINPCPAREVHPNIIDAFNKLPIDLNELYTNGDPFAATTEYRTDGFWNLPDQPIAKVANLLTKDQVDEIETQIEMFIASREPNWRANALKAFKVSSWAEIDAKHFDAIIKRIEAKKSSLFDMEEIPF